MSNAIFNSAEFVERLRANDYEAWKEFLGKAGKRLEKYYEAIGLAHEAEDLTSKTFIRLIKSGLSNYQSEKSSILTWAVNTGKLVAREHFTKETRRRALELEYTEALERESQVDYEKMIDCNERPQKEKSGSLSRGKLMKRALGSLSENERIIIEKRFVEGLSFELIAENLEISQSNARVRLTRARKKLSLEFERLHSSELRKRNIRSGRRNTRTSTSSPSRGKSPVAPTC